MQLFRKFLTAVGSAAILGSACYGATVTGMVKGPDGAPFQGAFVEAYNAKMKATFIVLSNAQGRYEIDKVPAGDYRMQIRAVGFTADPQSGVNLTSDQKTSFDFALKSGMVRWNDINFNQAMALWPAGKGKDVLVANCSICHLFQTRMASVRRDADGWKDRVEYMRTAMHFSLSRLSDADADALATYLTSLFGPDSVLPKSPADLPGYKATVQSFSPDAMNIVYVEYDMPGPSRMPFSAAPDKSGNIWIPDFGVANKITRLNPETGQMTDFPVPNVGTAAVHSTVPALDGTVWSAEQGANKLARWDPTTQTITEFQDTYAGGPENQGIARFGEKHTLRIDPSGNVWASGVPLTKFDPETKKFTHFDDVAGAYDVKPDKNGDVWFTSPNGAGHNQIGKVDGKTMKVTQWTPPTPNCFPRRLEIGADGIIWFTEFNSGKMGRFDPKTQTFQEFQLPGTDPAPYALGTDADGNLWYDSHHQDIIGKFDTKTDKVTVYPFPQSELSMREFFRDGQGRMWFGTNPNNKVGYWYLAK